VVRPTRPLSANGRLTGSTSRVDVTTTAWSMTCALRTSHLVAPLAGWGLVSVGAIAMMAAVLLLLADRGRWARTNPLATLACGLLAGVVLTCARRLGPRA
jgi:hypothetical protein